MIEINLLPEELKSGPRERSGPVAFNTKYVVYILPAAVALLLIIHILLIGAVVIKSVQLSSLQSKWKKLEPQRKQVEEFNKESAVLGQDAKLIKQLGGQRIIWSQKLNLLSLDLPAGIWFNELTASPTELLLHCSVISLEGRQIALIKTFMDKLKSDTTFFNDFSALELGPLQTSTVGGIEITTFTLKGVLKNK